MPAFFKAGGNIIIYNGPEPDHYIDMERVSDIGEFPVGRYDFIRWCYAKRVRMLDYPNDYLPEKIGFQPYITAEVYERLKVAFRQYRESKAKGQSTAGAEADAIFYAGWLGHYVADGANPLHTTIQHNGWVGPNPNGYTTAKIHWPVESDFINKNLDKVDPVGMVKAPNAITDAFHQYISYLKEQFALVEPLYQLEKRGGFANGGNDEGREFMRKQFAKGAQELVNLWYTAWVESAKEPPPYVPEPPKPAATPSMK